MIEENYILKKEYRDVDISSKEVKNKTFEQCYFINCKFIETIFSNCDFIDCKFDSCNFANAILPDTGLKTVIFEQSKLIGIDFYACKDFLFNVSFSDCILDFASFIKKNLKKTKFLNTSLESVNFSDADLSDSKFENCNLMNTQFFHSILVKADFSTSKNIYLNPNDNKIGKAKFSLNQLPGLLAFYNIIVE
ncbi:MAG: pentapeptide repeat-containing protein [Bacteroidota bacterium]